MASTVVGVYVRQGGVWERANGGTPTGFSGPQVYDAGAWRNCIDVQAYQSGWQIAWVNIDGELDVDPIGSFFLIASDFDGPSYEAAAEVRFNSNGALEYRTYNNNSPAPGFTQSGNWRPYDCGRSYELNWEEDKDNGPGVFTTFPSMTETVWYATSTTRTFTHRETAFDTGLFSSFSEYDFTIRVRETVTAPAGGNDTASYQTTIELGFGA